MNGRRSRRAKSCRRSPSRSANQMACITATAMRILRRHHRPATQGRDPTTLACAAGSQACDSILFTVIAEKTGYPPEMLSPEMALNADLGIDSIKRVEIFSALQERLPEAPVVKPENLGSLHT